MEQMIGGFFLAWIGMSVVIGGVWAIFFRGASIETKPLNQMSYEERVKILSNVG